MKVNAEEIPLISWKLLALFNWSMDIVGKTLTWKYFSTKWKDTNQKYANGFVLMNSVASWIEATMPAVISHICLSVPKITFKRPYITTTFYPYLVLPWVVVVHQATP